MASQGFDVCLWPDREWPEFGNDAKGIRALVRHLARLGPAAIGLEASGGYERDALAALCPAGLPVHRLNALRVRRFAQGCGIMAKNYRIDAAVIARFVSCVPQAEAGKPPKGILVAIMRKLVTALNAMLRNQQPWTP